MRSKADTGEERRRFLYCQKGKMCRFTLYGGRGGAGFWDLFPNRGALSRRDFEWGYLFLLPLLLHPQSDTRCERHVVRGERYAPASLPYPLLLPPGAGLGLKVGTHKMMVTISGL